jgi:hypothetical protein
MEMKEKERRERSLGGRTNKVEMTGFVVWGIRGWRYLQLVHLKFNCKQQGPETNGT